MTTTQIRYFVATRPDLSDAWGGHLYQTRDSAEDGLYAARYRSPQHNWEIHECYVSLDPPPQWRPASEPPPVEFGSSGFCAVACDLGVVPGRMLSNGEWKTANGYLLTGVTHWQPMPKPPTKPPEQQAAPTDRAGLPDAASSQPGETLPLT